MLIINKKLSHKKHVQVLIEILRNRYRRFEINVDGRYISSLNGEWNTSCDGSSVMYRYPGGGAYLLKPTRMQRFLLKRLYRKILIENDQK